MELVTNYNLRELSSPGPYTPPRRIASGTLVGTPLSTLIRHPEVWERSRTIEKARDTGVTSCCGFAQTS
jgi:hypothetical protein